MAEAAKKFYSSESYMLNKTFCGNSGILYEKIDEFREFIAKENLVTGGTGAKVRPVVSCKGTTCQYGLLDSYAISEDIYKRFYEGYRDIVLPHNLRLQLADVETTERAKPNLNDVGIIGQRIRKVNTDICKGCKK